MKYKLTYETMTTESGVLLHRIECVESFGNIKEGDRGGWIEKEENLSQCGNCWVHGNAQVYGNARVSGNAWVYYNARVYGNALVYGNAWVYSNARVYGNAEVYGNAQVYDNARVYGNALVYGNAQVSEDAVICNSNDYIVFKNNWSSFRHFTWTRSNDMWKVGCFYGTGKELIEKAYKDSKLSGDCYKAYVELVEKLKEQQKQ